MDQRQIDALCDELMGPAPSRSGRESSGFVEPKILPAASGIAESTGYMREKVAVASYAAIWFSARKWQNYGPATASLARSNVVSAIDGLPCAARRHKKFDKTPPSLSRVKAGPAPPI